MNSAFAPLCGLKGSALVFVIILYLDYSRALILLANSKTHLLLRLSLPFSAIPPTAAGVVPRLRESTWTTRNVRLFSFGNLWAPVTARQVQNVWRFRFSVETWIFRSLRRINVSYRSGHHCMKESGLTTPVARVKFCCPPVLCGTLCNARSYIQLPRIHTERK